MAKRNIITGIDIGSSNVRVVVCETRDPSRPPLLIATGSAPSRGVRRGYVSNVETAARSIALAVSRAEKAAGTKIDNAFLSAGGIGLEGRIGVGVALISAADGEIDTNDVERAMLGAESSLKDNVNKRVLHSIPLAFRLDGKEIFGRPRGMKGVRLEAKVLVITAHKAHIDDLIGAVDMAGVEVIDVFPSPIAASCVSLSKQQKTAGCVLVDLGSETLTMAVFENNLPVSLEVFPIGSTDITNDIALKMQISLEEAEKLKLGRFDERNKQDLEKIVEGRLKDIFALIENHLKKIYRNGLLPAGIILLGAGSGVRVIEEVAKDVLKLPSSTALLRYRDSRRGDGEENASKEKFVKDGPTWAVAYGLCILGNQSDEDESVFSSSKDLFKTMKEKIGGVLKQFLP